MTNDVSSQSSAAREAARESTGRFGEQHHAEPDLALPVPPSPEPVKFPETQRRIRGHNFFPPKSVTSKIPGLYETEEVPLEEKKIHAHFFTGGADWYVAEYDTQTGEAFGYADLGHGHGEWGTFSLPDLEQVNIGGWRVVERDCYFGSPQTLAEAEAHRGR